MPCALCFFLNSLLINIKASVSSLWMQKVLSTYILSSSVERVNVEMEGFETPRQIFTWLWIYPEARGTGWLERMAHITFAFVVFLANLFGSLAHWGYLWKFISIDFKGCVFAFMGVTVFTCLTYIIITVFRLRNQICSIIDKLLDIYQSRKYFDHTRTFSI